MTEPETPADLTTQRRRALSRWDNEGGALPPRDLGDTPDLTNTELVQLRVRVIALENLVIGLLADAPERQLEAVRQMAQHILPQPGATQHPLTIHAADHMTDLVARAVHFRTV